MFGANENLINKKVQVGNNQEKAAIPTPKTEVGKTTLTITYEPVHEKTNNLEFRPGPTQTGLYTHRRRLEA